MYKQIPFSVRPLDEIESDLRALRRIFPRAETIFLGDSDSLVRKDIAEVVALIRRYFPEASRLTCYSRLRTLKRRRQDDLSGLRRAGLVRIHTGLESGNTEILQAVAKGLSPEVAVEGAQKALEAGFELSVYVLCGLGGEVRWREHATSSAGVVAAMEPDFLRLRSLVLIQGCEMRKWYEEGSFRPAGPRTRLIETHLFIEKLAEETARRGTQVHLLSDHFSNYAWADGTLVYRGVDGLLPDEAPRMLGEIEEALEAIQGARHVEDPGTLGLRDRFARL